MAKTYQASNFTGKQLDEFMGKVLTGELAGSGLKLDSDGVLHNTTPGYGNLVYSYTHTANKEVYVEGVNLATGVFTSTGHGLTANQTVVVAMHAPYHLKEPYKYLPGGLSLGSQGGNVKIYYVNVLDEDSFSVSETSGGTAVTFTEVSTMDLTKFHFEVEKKTDLIINNLPAFDACKVVVRGRVIDRFRYVNPSPCDVVSGKIGYYSHGAFAGVDQYGSLGIGNSGGFGSLHSEIEFKIVEPGHILSEATEYNLSYNATNGAKANWSKRHIHIYTNQATMTGVLFQSYSGGQFFNGTVVEVYTK